METWKALLARESQESFVVQTYLFEGKRALNKAFRTPQISVPPFTDLAEQDHLLD